MRGAMAICLAGLLALLVLPGLANAATQLQRDRESAPPSTARLQVEGDGMIRLTGRLVAFGLLPEEATIWILDLSGDARFYLDGREPALREEGVTRLHGRSGRFYVSGSSLLFQVRGDRLSLSAAGRGRAWLMGDGIYRLNERAAERWSTERWPPPPLALVPEPGTPTGAT